MNLLRAIAISFSTYSHIPMPQFSWEESDRKYAIIFLPLVGCVIGLGFLLWVSFFSSFSPLFVGVGCMLLPLVLTGGIHMDGFLDTCDALASLQDKEKRLAILKDVHVGAFAVIKGMMYLLALTGLYAEGAKEITIPLACGFVVSRSISMMMMLALNNTRGDGMLHAMQDGMPRRGVQQSAFVFCAFACSLSLIICLPPTLIAMIGVLISTVHFHRMALTKFGGITGDLAGYCIQHTELWWALGLIIAWRLL